MPPGRRFLLFGESRAAFATKMVSSNDTVHLEYAHRMMLDSGYVPSIKRTAAVVTLVHF
jgi:hypothetical protein